MQVQHGGRSRAARGTGQVGFGHSSRGVSEVCAATARAGGDAQQLQRPHEHRGGAVAPVARFHKRAAALWPQVRGAARQMHFNDFLVVALETVSSLAANRSASSKTLAYDMLLV